MKIQDMITIIDRMHTNSKELYKVDRLNSYEEEAEASELTLGILNELQQVGAITTEEAISLIRGYPKLARERKALEEIVTYNKKRIAELQTENKMQALSLNLARYLTELQVADAAIKFATEKAAYTERELKEGLIKSGFNAFRYGQLLPETEQEKSAADGACVEFCVYLGREKSAGNMLNSVEQVVLPTVTKNVIGSIEPMTSKLVFRSLEYAEAVIKVIGKQCTIEIRAVVQYLRESGEWDARGCGYILDAVPLKIAPEPLTRGGGTEIAVSFAVYRYAAHDTEDNERWSFEWQELVERLEGKGGA